MTTSFKGYLRGSVTRSLIRRPTSMTVCIRDTLLSTFESIKLCWTSGIITWWTDCCLTWGSLTNKNLIFWYMTSQINGQKGDIINTMWLSTNRRVSKDCLQSSLELPSPLIRLRFILTYQLVKLSTNFTSRGITVCNRYAAISFLTNVSNDSVKETTHLSIMLLESLKERGSTWKDVSAFSLQKMPTFWIRNR